MALGLRLLWTLLAIIGVNTVIASRAGHGIDIFEFWLIPLAASAGILDSIIRLGFVKTTPLLIVWVLTLFVYINVLTSPNIIALALSCVLAIIGVILLFVYAFLKPSTKTQ